MASKRVPHPKRPYNLEGDDADWNGCIKAFLEARPDVRGRVRWTQEADGEHFWAKAPDIYAFYEWAGQQGYMPAAQVQWMITHLRQREDAQHNEQN